MVRAGGEGLYEIGDMLLQDRDIRELTRVSKNEHNSMALNINLKRMLDDQAVSFLTEPGDMVSTNPKPADAIERFIEASLYGWLGNCIAVSCASLVALL